MASLAKALIAIWRVGALQRVSHTEEIETNEETGENVFVKRHTERFSNDVTLLYEDGRTQVLGEKPPLADAAAEKAAA